MLKSIMNGKRILAFGAHPDDIEFGCGAVLLDATANEANITMVVLSKGEAGTHGDSATREAEAQKAANMLGAELQFLPSGGDTQIRADLESTQEAAKIIRQKQPDIVLCPSGHLNQHPDHRETNLMVRDAYRLARYGKTPGLGDTRPHSTSLLLFEWWIGLLEFHSDRCLQSHRKLETTDGVPCQPNQEYGLRRIATFTSQSLRHPDGSSFGHKIIF
jgi:LmbE family N-acetylglucosaminyl deacetylase